MLLSFSISLIGLFLLLLNVILFTFGLKKKDKKVQLITIHLILLFAIELLCHIIGWTNPGNNLFLSHYYFNSQFIVLSVVFYQLLENRISKILILFNLIVIPSIILYSYIDNPNLYNKFNIIEITLTTAALCLYSALYFIATIHPSGKFHYFTIGLVLYLVNSLFIFLSGNTETVFIEAPYIDIWIFNSLFFILYQIFIIKNWKILKHEKSKPTNTSI